MAKKKLPYQYIFVPSSDLNNVPLVEGNIIALSDTNGWYYDVGNPVGSGQNIERISISANYVYVESLPDTGNINTIYVLNTGTMVIGTDTPYYEVYIWENEAWQLIANNSADANVTSLSNSNVQFYVTGSTLSTGTTGSLVKRPDIFVTDTGKLSAKGFIGGAADNAKNAIHAQEADLAQVALKDNSGNDIDKYIKSIQPNAQDPYLLVTYGDGTSENLPGYVPPTVSTTSAGLAPQIPSDTTRNVLYRDGWKALDVSGLSADSATNDSAGQEIISTYIKGLSFDTTNRTLTATKGNDSTLPAISIPDTTYSDYSGPGNGHGLVPASISGDANRYLRVDGTWVTPDSFLGATSSTNGAVGFVPAPQSANINSYLKGDGTWSDISVFNGSDAGLVPSTVDNDKYLLSDGTWVDLPILTGATYNSDGEQGLVPTPTSADITKYLKGDGTWSTPSIPVFTYNTPGSVPAPGSTNASNYLSASGIWRPVTLNTTGTLESSGQTSTFVDNYLGDGSTVSFTLSETPISGTLSVLVDSLQLVLNTDYTLSGDVITLNTAPTTVNVTDNFTVTPVNLYALSVAPLAITSVTVSGTTVSSSDYTLTGNVLSFNDPSGYTENDPVVITYTHIQVVTATYTASLDNAKLYIVSAPNQAEYNQTYSNSSAYVKAGKLYSDNKEVATINSVADNTFTANSNISVSVHKFGSMYSITLDGTANSAINAGSTISTTTQTFAKTYAVGMVDTTPALFKIEGNSITCNIAISANSTVAVSITALA